MHGDHAADQVLGRLWEAYAQRERAQAGQDYPGRDRVVGIFGEPEPFDVVVAPFDHRWRGLAASTGAPRIDPEQLAARVLADLADAKQPGTLHRACRSTDVPALAATYALPVYWSSNLADMCTVLRSWEDRFGTRIVALSHDRLTVSVTVPRVRMAEAEAIAAEHFAFSSDTITQGHCETLRAYAAKEVLGRQVWGFWWD